MKPPYKTVGKQASAEFIEKRSRFIGSVRPVKTEPEALAFIEEIHAKYKDVSHHAFAYIVKDGGFTRFSDAGEPSGTAGRPILELFQKEEIVDVCCVVTRYFGGVLLGAGGLTRAYGHGAKIALDEAGRVLMRIVSLFKVSCAYTHLGSVQAILENNGCSVADITYVENVTIFSEIEPQRLGVLNRKLMDGTAGAVQAEVFGEEYRGILV